MITAKFSPQCKISELEVFEFKTYKEFFEWYIKHYNKGAIYGVKDDGETAEK
jgi:hypothetical protein